MAAGLKAIENLANICDAYVDYLAMSAIYGEWAEDSEVPASIASVIEGAIKDRGMVLEDEVEKVCQKKKAELAKLDK